MDILLKSGFLALAFILLTGSSAAVERPFAGDGMSDPLGRVALAAIERDIRGALHEDNRRQLLDTLPAELSAMSLNTLQEATVAAAPARSDAVPTRVVVIATRSQSRSAEERAPLRWQSLLPGMMK